jgi:hypothetical protein
VNGLLHGGQEAERDRGKGLGQDITFKKHASNDLLPPSRPNLPIGPSHYEFINYSISLLRKTEPSSSNHFPKALPLNIALGSFNT